MERIKNLGIKEMFIRLVCGPLSQKIGLSVSQEELFDAWRLRNKYRVFAIGKGRRQKRTISAPPETLKQVQRSILDWVLYYYPVSESTQGFVPQKSIVTNAVSHLKIKPKARFKIDLKEAFPSVTKDRIKQLFLGLGFQEVEAEILTDLTTFRGNLPQGAPTSGYLLNLVCRELDQELIEYCNSYGWCYTRYADDLIISSPDCIPKVRQREILEIVESWGFEVNQGKIDYQVSQREALKITGLKIVKGKIRPPRKMLRKIRGFIHSACQDPEIFEKRVAGYIGYLKMIFGEIPPQIRKPYLSFLNSLAKAREK